MNIIQCSCGRFINVDKFDVCPLCGVSINENKNIEEENKKKSGGKIFSLLGKPASKSKTNREEHDSANYSIETADEQTKDDAALSVEKEHQHDSTMSLWEPIEDSVWEPTENNVVKEEEYHNQDDSAVENDNSNQTDRIQNDDLNTEQSESIKEVIRQASASSIGKTLGYFEKKTGQTEALQSPGRIDPVVGWLVCISGPHFGESFKISAGGNSIGRSPENKIVIGFDQSVSSSKHALLTFEPKKCMFYLKGGDESRLTYVNGNAVFETTQINTMDEIEIGDSKFLLIPLCSEEFSWDKYLETK